MKIRTHIGRFLVLVFTLLFSLSPPAIADYLTVHFLDVGQGDSILIQHETSNILIDGGDRKIAVVEKITAYLEARNVEKLNAVVGTHPHADHIGGLLSVIESFPVKAVFDSGRIHTSKTYESYMALIDENNIPLFTPSRGDTIETGAIVFDVLHPGQEIEDYCLNNASLVLRLEYGEVSFLFTGDAEKQAELEMIEAEVELDSTVLKIGHHGSNSSSILEFLTLVDPEIAIIQVGEGNRYGHPHKEVLERLRERDIEIYRTDIHGDIVVKTDGTKYKVITEHTAVEEDYEEPRENDSENKININKATALELQALWGVGPTIADRIIEYREQHGPFLTKEDIMSVDGIDEKKFSKWEDEITI